MNRFERASEDQFLGDDIPFIPGKLNFETPDKYRHFPKDFNPKKSQYDKEILLNSLLTGFIIGITAFLIYRYSQKGRSKEQNLLFI